MSEDLKKELEEIRDTALDRARKLILAYGRIELIFHEQQREFAKTLEQLEAIKAEIEVQAKKNEQDLRFLRTLKAEKAYLQ